MKMLFVLLAFTILSCDSKENKINNLNENTLNEKRLKEIYFPKNNVNSPVFYYSGSAERWLLKSPIGAKELIFSKITDRTQRNPDGEFVLEMKSDSDVNIKYYCGPSCGLGRLYIDSMSWNYLNGEIHLLFDGGKSLEGEFKYYNKYKKVNINSTEFLLKRTKSIINTYKGNDLRRSI